MDVLGKINAPIKKLGTVTPLVLRVILGLTMFWHGWKKFDAGLSGTKDFFDFLSIPLPGVMAFVVAVLELVGGIALVVGIATRLISVLFIIELLVAVLRYKYGEDVGFIGADQAGAELDWALIAGFFALATMGAGALLSGDRRLGLDRHS